MVSDSSLLTGVIRLNYDFSTDDNWTSVWQKERFLQSELRTANL